MKTAPNSSDWSVHNYLAALYWLKKVWEASGADDAARKEGWNIWECSGSENAPFQICMYDSPEDDQAALTEDAEAWKIVCEGTGEHHQLAREFLTLFVPNTEMTFIEKWCKEQGNG